MTSERWHIKQAQRAWNAKQAEREQLGYAPKHERANAYRLPVDGIDGAETRLKISDTSFLGDQSAVFNTDEIKAGQDDPRPGVLYVHLHAAPLSQISWNERQTTQDETDALIVFELQAKCPTDEVLAFIDLVTTNGQLPTLPMRPPAHVFQEQRGGIHSEPLVRILAYRMWGDRDRKFDFDREKTSHFQAVASHPQPRGDRRRSENRSPKTPTHLHNVGCDDPDCDGQCIR